jgi:predicted permease
MKARDLEAGAMSAVAADAEALRRFGDLEEIRGQCLTIQSAVSRRRSRGGALDGFLHNTRVAIRVLRRRPGLTAAAVLTLALGIGVNAAMFGVVSKVVLAPLPFQAPDRVVQLWDLRPEQEQGSSTTISLDNFRDYESRNDVFSHVAAIRPVDLYVERDGRIEFMQGQHLSSDLFDMMGVVPSAGRTFRADEDVEGVASVVLLTHAYWLREFGGEEVLGRTIPLRRWIWPEPRDWVTAEYEIVGVLPADFRVPPLSMGEGYGVEVDPEVILPLGLWTWGRGDRGMYSIRTLAQLRDGVSLEQAQANVQAIARGIAESTPETQVGMEATVVPVGELLTEEYGVALGFLWAATALVLLVACASVSSLLLGWGVAREQELAVRAALGAGARRIFSQLLTEGMVLTAAAGALGVLLAYWGIGALKILAPAGVHRLDEVGLDVGVLGFTLGVSLLTVLMVGLWPALRGARGHSSEVLKAGGRGSTLARTRSLRALVTAEVAVSLVLLAGAGLMLQSFWNLVRVDTGIGAERVLHVAVRLPHRQLSKYTSAPQFADLYRLMRDRVEAIPGVTAFASAEFVPLSGGEPFGIPVTMADRPRPEAAQFISVSARGVSPGIFRTLGIQFVEGRPFDRGEWDRRFVPSTTTRRAPRDPLDFSWQLVPRQVVISEGMARTFWPGESPLGKIFYYGRQDPAAVARTLGTVRRSPLWDPMVPPPFRQEVVGVVRDVRNSLGREPMPAYYHLQPDGTSYYVRASVDPAGLAEVLRREIEAVDPSEIEVTQIRTLEQMVSERSADSRFRAVMVVLFAVLATGLTCLGLFGVLTYAVTQRTRELGIRIALGASHSEVARLVLRPGAQMAGLGIATGLVLVFWMTRYISSLLFGVVPMDPTTLLGVAALIFALSLVAAYLPARRAMRVDPIVALRHE